MGALSWILGLVAGAAALFALVRVGLLMWNRRRYTVTEHPGFLSAEECAHLIRRAEPRMKKSKVIFEGQRGGDHIDRESATAFLDQAGDPIVHGIKRRIAELTGTRIEQQERIQVTHYGENQLYDLHYDALRAGRLDPGEAGDRILTVIVYLNDDFEGGATYFPRVRKRVRAEKGKAVVFRNTSEDGSSWDRLSIHTGERVRGGEKWLSNQWIRQNDRYARQAPARRATGRRGRAARGRR